MNKHLILSLTVLIVAAGFTLTPQTAFSNCENGNLKLKAWKRGLKLTPAKGPKCLFVNDLANVNTSFTIDLDPRGNLSLVDNDVTVIQVDNKPGGCGSNLILGGDLTNTSEDTMVITVKGTNVAENETVCFDISVKDIGMLDPRARVRDQGRSFREAEVASEIDELLRAHEVLIDSDLGGSLEGQSLDLFLQQTYDMTEQQARAFVAEYLR